MAIFEIVVAGETHGRENVGGPDVSGDPDYAVRELPELNHLFQTSQTGAISEYGTMQASTTLTFPKLHFQRGWSNEQ